MAAARSIIEFSFDGEFICASEVFVVFAKQKSFDMKCCHKR